jgi:hypothetical protein
LKHKFLYTTISSFGQAIFLGFYINFFSTEFEKNNIKSFQTLGAWNILLFLTIGLLIFNIWIESADKSHQSKNRTQIINKILENACKALVSPNHNNSKHIRAIITICDYKKGKRKTTYSYNISASPERTAEYDIYFGVTGKAIRDKVVVAEELPNDHIDSYPERHKVFVDSKLKCVLAAPIFSLNNPDDVVGVLAFDSQNNLKTLKFDTSESKEIAQSWADILSHLM